MYSRSTILILRWTIIIELGSGVYKKSTLLRFSVSKQSTIYARRLFECGHISAAVSSVARLYLFRNQKNKEVTECWFIREGNYKNFTDTTKIQNEIFTFISKITWKTIHTQHQRCSRDDPLSSFFSCKSFIMSHGYYSHA